MVAVFLCLFIGIRVAFTQQALAIEADSFVVLANASNDPVEKANLYMNAADKFHRFDPQQGLKYGNMALEVALRVDDQDLLGAVYNALGASYYRLSDYERALVYFQHAVDAYLASGNELMAGSVLGNMGFMKISLGDHAGGLEMQFEVLKIFEKLEHKTFQANTLAAISTVYQYEEQYEPAVDYGKQALQIYRETEDDEGIALILGNLGNLYDSMEEYETGLEYHYEALDLFQKLGQHESIARTHSNIANTLRDNYRFLESLDHLQIALGIFEAIPYPSGIAIVKSNIGAAYLASHMNREKQEWEQQLIPGSASFLLGKAIANFKETLTLFEELGEWRRVGSVAENLYIAYQELGLYEEALAYYKQYTVIKDSIHTIERQERIEELTTQRELDVRDKQIELDRLAVAKKRNERRYFGIGIGLLLLTTLLIYRNYANQRSSNVQLTSLNGQLSHTLQDLRSTQAQLVESEKQKANALLRGRISQDIHDDISSGLTKIAWLAEAFMAKTSTAAVDVAPLEKINEQARDTVSKLGEIIWSSNPDRDNLESLLTYMRNHIYQYMEDAPMRWRVDFPEEVPDISLSPIIRRNLFLAMKEALHNARKYSQADEIVVSFELKNQRYLLEIRDNGQGMTPGEVQGGGNGMANMRRRMAAINGTMHLDTAPGEGLRLVFEGSLEDGV